MYPRPCCGAVPREDIQEPQFKVNSICVHWGRNVRMFFMVQINHYLIIELLSPRHPDTTLFHEKKKKVPSKGGLQDGRAGCWTHDGQVLLDTLEVPVCKKPLSRACPCQSSRGELSPECAVHIWLACQVKLLCEAKGRIASPREGDAESSALELSGLEMAWCP